MREDVTRPRNQKSLVSKHRGGFDFSKAGASQPTEEEEAEIKARAKQVLIDRLGYDPELERDE